MLWKSPIISLEFSLCLTLTPPCIDRWRNVATVVMIGYSGFTPRIACSWKLSPQFLSVATKRQCPEQPQKSSAFWPTENQDGTPFMNALNFNHEFNLLKKCVFYFIASVSSVQFSRSVVSDSLRPYELQHARPPCPSPTPGIHSDSHPSRRWCHPAISSSVVPFSSCPQSLPASESCPMSQHFAWGGQSTGLSALASFLPKKSQGWSPSE